MQYTNRYGVAMEPFQYLRYDLGSLSGATRRDIAGYVSEQGAVWESPHGFSTASALVRRIKEPPTRLYVGRVEGTGNTPYQEGKAFADAMITAMAQFSERRGGSVFAESSERCLAVLFDFLFEDNPTGLFQVHGWDDETLLRHIERMLACDNVPSTALAFLTALGSVGGDAGIPCSRAARYLASACVRPSKITPEAVRTAHDMCDHHDELLARGHPEQWAWRITHAKYKVPVITL